MMEDYRRPAPSLFALCIRQLVLQSSADDFHRLPQHLVNKVEDVQNFISKTIRLHKPYVSIDPSWICIKANGCPDWPATCARCCYELSPEDAFVFAAINGIASRVMWYRLSTEERVKLLAAENSVISNTALLLNSAITVPPIDMPLKYSSVQTAAKLGWPGAALAWLGMYDNRLKNGIYCTRAVAGVAVVRDEMRFLDYPPGSDEGFVALRALFYGHFHMLRYFSVAQIPHSFVTLFPDGRVPLHFLHILSQAPTLECRRNRLLCSQLQHVASELLHWLPRINADLLRYKASEIQDVELARFIDCCAKHSCDSSAECTDYKSIDRTYP